MGVFLRCSLDNESEDFAEFAHMKTHEQSAPNENLNEAQKRNLRALFEPKYGRTLDDQELWEIHFNLKRFFMAIAKAEHLSS